MRVPSNEGVREPAETAGGRETGQVPARSPDGLDPIPTVDLHALHLRGKTRSLERAGADPSAASARRDGLQQSWNNQPNSDCYNPSRPLIGESFRRLLRKACYLMDDRILKITSPESNTVRGPRINYCVATDYEVFL